MSKFSEDRYEAALERAKAAVEECIEDSDFGDARSEFDQGFDAAMELFMDVVFGVEVRIIPPTSPRVEFSDDMEA